MNVIAQMPLFQSNTFFPSNTKNGSMLKNPKKKLILAPQKNIVCTNPDTMNPANKKTSPITKLVNGPAMEISPFSLAVKFSLKMYTAPGAAKRNPKNAVINANNNPNIHARNSAIAPNLNATNLCASSCSTNPVPTVIKAVINASSKLSIPLPEKISQANAMLKTIHAMTMSLISAALKPSLGLLNPNSSIKGIPTEKVKNPSNDFVIERKNALLFIACLNQWLYAQRKFC